MLWASINQRITPLRSPAPLKGSTRPWDAATSAIHTTPHPSAPIGCPHEATKRRPCAKSTAGDVNRPLLPPISHPFPWRGKQTPHPRPHKSLYFKSPPQPITLDLFIYFRIFGRGEEEREMDEAWERAVEAALHTGGEGGSSSPARSLTLDGAVKCMHGRLPAAQILERHQGLEHLSIAGVGVASLQGFPRLRNLTRLTLSDNRIAGGLEHLVEAGLGSLRDLDLSNNRIQDVDDLAPLARLRLVSLDLYECPVTRVKDYRSRVFGLIRTLRYLDKMDADENERPESDDDDDDGDGDGDGEEDDEDEDDEDEDPGSGEVANGGVSHSRGSVAAHPVEVNGVIDVDEDESDADEVVPNGGAQQHHRTNGFRVAAVGEGAPDEDDEDVEDDEDDDDEYDEEDDLGEEIDEEGDEDDAVVEVHDVPSSEDEEDDIDEEDDDDVEEEVEDEGEEAEPESSGRVAMAVGGVGEEIDGHEQGEGDDDDDENGEIGEEDEERLEDNRVYEEGNDDDDADDEDEDTEYLVQPIVPPQAMAVGSPEDFDVADPDDVDEDRDEVDDDDDEGGTDQPSSSQGTKRKRGGHPSGGGSDDEDDDVEDPRPFKHH